MYPAHFEPHWASRSTPPRCAAPGCSDEDGPLWVLQPQRQPQTQHPRLREQHSNRCACGSQTLPISTARTTPAPAPPSEPRPWRGSPRQGHHRLCVTLLQRGGCGIPRPLTCGFSGRPVNQGQLACLDSPFPPLPSRRTTTPPGETAPSRNARLLRRPNCFQCLSQQPGSPRQSTRATAGAQLFLLPLPRRSLTRSKRLSTRRSPDEYRQIGRC